MIEMWRQFEAPRTAKQEIHDDDAVVYLLGMEVAVAAETPGVLRVIALRSAGEKRQIPILGNVPVEGVERVQEYKEQP